MYRSLMTGRGRECPKTLEALVLVKGLAEGGPGGVGVHSGEDCVACRWVHSVGDRWDILSLYLFHTFLPAWHRHACQCKGAGLVAVPCSSERQMSSESVADRDWDTRLLSAFLSHTGIPCLCLPSLRAPVLPGVAQPSVAVGADWLVSALLVLWPSLWWRYWQPWLQH